MQSPLQYKALSFGMMDAVPLYLIFSTNLGPCEGSPPAKYDHLPQFPVESLMPVARKAQPSSQLAQI